MWIRSHELPLAGWIHRPSDLSSLNGRGLLICNPVGHELIHAHQSIREMADSFARAGYSVLRFDYTGTGDSDGDEFADNIVAKWLDDIVTAADYLRAACGTDVRQVIGIRSGALLAAACAERLSPADGLILWDPIPSGRRFLRELKANEKLAYFRCEPDLLESVGFPYPTPMLRDLKELDIASSLRAFPAPVVAFVRDSAPVPATISKIGEDSLDFDCIQVPGLATMLVEPHNALIPHDAIGRAVTWASEHLDRVPPEPAPEALTISNEVAFSGSNAGIVESVIRVSEGGSTGILCRGPNPKAHERPIVLFGNAGSIYHIGPNRLYVTLARRLAKAGFTSFRYDLPNMGDGLQTPHPEANYPYPEDAVERITEVIEYARSDFGHPSVILTGVCSGATQAFLAAMRQEPTTALIETAMVNPKVFYVEDITQDGSNFVMQRANYYSRAVGDRDRWRRLFTGQIDYRKLFDFLTRRAWQLLRKVGGRIGRVFGMAPGTRLGRDLVTYVKTGRKLSFFFSSRDPGHRVLLESSDGVANRLIRKGEIPVAIIEDADHTMIARRCREDFMTKFTERMTSTYPAG